MNSTQIAAGITTLLGFLGGYAVAHGFSPAEWTAVVGGVAALAAWAYDYFGHKTA